MLFNIPIIHDFYASLFEDLDYYKDNLCLSDVRNLKNAFRYIIDNMLTSAYSKKRWSEEACNFIVDIAANTFVYSDDYRTNISKFLSYVFEKSFPISKSLESEIFDNETNITDVIAGYVIFLLQRTVTLSAHYLERYERVIDLIHVKKAISNDVILERCFELEENDLGEDDYKEKYPDTTESFEEESKEYSSDFVEEEINNTSYDTDVEMEERSPPKKGRFSLRYIDEMDD